MKPARSLPLLLATAFLLAISCGSLSEGDPTASGSPDDGSSRSSGASEGSETAAAKTEATEATAEATTPAPETTADRAAKGDATGGGTAGKRSREASKPEREPTPVDKVVEVNIRALKYLPGPVEVSPGTTVRWTNEDQALHTVTSEDSGGPLRSAELAKGEPYEQTFRKPGQYDYYCKVHPFMKSGVTVE